MRKRLIRAGRRLLLLTVVMAIVFCTLRGHYRGVIIDLTESSVKKAAVELIHSAIIQQLDSGSIQYDQIIYFEKDMSGRITALQTNIAAVNRFKADILSQINSQILALDTSDIGIPLGSLVFPEFFSGKGPAIPVHILSIRNSNASFDNHFAQAGINQTLYQLEMTVNMDIAVLVMGQTESFRIGSQVVVAQTIIVGDVPGTLIQSGGKNGA